MVALQCCISFYCTAGESAVPNIPSVLNTLPIQAPSYSGDLRCLFFTLSSLLLLCLLID